MHHSARLAVLILALCAAAAAGPVPEARVAELATSLRQLYGTPPAAHERWSEASTDATRRAASDSAWSEDPAFEPAVLRLLEHPVERAPALGAWLLRSRREEASPELVRALQATLLGRDGVAATEAARTLAARGGRAALTGLDAGAQRAPSAIARAAAGWAAAELREQAPPAASPRLPRGFRRGVNWWYEAQDGDGGGASFRRLHRLGVDWVSVHTWDPLQVSAGTPEFATPGRRFVPRDMGVVVRAAHAAGVQVMAKPHLEMARVRPSDAERSALASPDPVLREKTRAALKERSQARGWHGEIEMKGAADWAAWFANYETYLMAHARDAQKAGADALCVGRELDRTVLAREKDWRGLIARVRGVFKGALTYSAHHDSFDRLGFWDALDFAGVSAYFPIASAPQPPDAELAAGWLPVQARLASFRRKIGKPVVITEIGYPALAGAGARPWEERDEAADPWLQARLLDGAFAALSKTEGVEGAFVWLWEGVGTPPFRDNGFTVNGKPAEFALARWFAGHGR